MEQRSGVALCLSGGGYRAALFELGAMRRLNELGVLSRVTTVTSVSAGGIASAHLTEVRGSWPEPGQAIPDFDRTVQSPTERFVARNLRTAPLVARWLMPWRWPSDSAAIDHLASLFERYLPARSLREFAVVGNEPRFVFIATDNSFADAWRMSADRNGSDAAGYHDDTDWSVGRAVAVSASFPPAFEPAHAGADPDALRGGDFPGGSKRDELISGLRLNDGGLIDELAVEPVWRDHRHIIALDGGSPYRASEKHGLKKDIEILRKQVHEQRKRWLISSFASGEIEGTYLGIESHVSHFDADAEGYSEDLVSEVIAAVRTDFDRFSRAEIAVLQNHGYLLAEAAAQRHLRDSLDLLSAPLEVPYPEFMDESDVREALSDSSERTLLGRGPWLRYLF